MSTWVGVQCPPQCWVSALEVDSVTVAVLSTMVSTCPLPRATSWHVCQLVSSWATNVFNLSRYWLYSSTSLWPAPWQWLYRDFQLSRNFSFQSLLCSQTITLEIIWMFSPPPTEAPRHEDISHRLRGRVRSRWLRPLFHESPRRESWHGELCRYWNMEKLMILPTLNVPSSQSQDHKFIAQWLVLLQTQIYYNKLFRKSRNVTLEMHQRTRFSW